MSLLFIIFSLMRLGLVSRHIVVTRTKNLHPHYPINGIILVYNETIEDIIMLSPNFTFDSLRALYPDLNLIDYSDYYISPGLIDLNVRKECESLSDLTRSAISGGVTFIAVEDGYYHVSGSNLAETSNDLFCDVGQVQVITEKTVYDDIDDYSIALKAYLFPPSTSIESVTNLQRMITQVYRTNLPLLIDATLPDPRMLYMASPLRLDADVDRTENENKSSSYFAAAFSGNADDSSEESMSDSESSGGTPIRSASFQCDELKIIRNKLSLSSDDDTDSKDDKEADNLMIIEATEKDESTPVKDRYTKRKSVVQIFEELDNRIKASEQNIEDLCIAEKSTYSFSGLTHFFEFDMPKKVVPSFPQPEITIPPSQISGPPKTRERFRPKPIVTKHEAKPDVSRDYNYHLANYPEHWEINGVAKVIDSLMPFSKVHFQNLSSAVALNKIRKAKKKNKNISSEVSAANLYFTSVSVKSGDTRFKNSPPIRNRGNFNLLWDLLKMKGIDAISSQHAHIDQPHKITPSFQQALNGISSIGCSLQSVWGILNIPATKYEVLENYIIRLAKWLSWHPAVILNISEKRGSIEKGKYADLVVWNPNEKVLVNGKYHYCSTSPFEGYELLGSIRTVYLRGKKVFDNGETVPVGRKIYKGK